MSGMRIREVLQDDKVYRLWRGNRGEDGGKMKGITPVIAVILLIMITISMVGFLFVWFSNYLSSLSQYEERWECISWEEKQECVELGLVWTVGQIRLCNTDDYPYLFIYEPYDYANGCELEKWCHETNETLKSSNTEFRRICKIKNIDTTGKCCIDFYGIYQNEICVKEITVNVTCTKWVYTRILKE